MRPVSLAKKQSLDEKQQKKKEELKKEKEQDSIYKTMLGSVCNYFYFAQRACSGSRTEDDGIARHLLPSFFE